MGEKVQIEGDVQHPANLGKLCIKGTILLDTWLKTRLLHPITGRKEQRQISTWDHAISSIANKFQQCIDQYGSRQHRLLCLLPAFDFEDYYVVNKFVKGYLGTANIDTNSRLCACSLRCGGT